MLDFEIQVSGLDELEDILTNRAPAAAIRTLRNIGTQGGKVFKAGAVGTAPYDDNEPGPHLRDNVVISTKVSGDELTVRVGPGKNVFWGMFQEFGTEDQPAQHWLQRAFDLSVGQ